MLLTVHSLKISIKHVLENLQSFQQLENILIVLFLQLFLGWGKSTNSSFEARHW